MYSFSYLQPVCCSMSNSNCCFLTCMQVSQEADQVVWHSRLFKNIPQFIVIHTVKGFGIVNKAEIDVFLELSCFILLNTKTVPSFNWLFCLNQDFPKCVPQHTYSWDAKRILFSFYLASQVRRKR